MKIFWGRATWPDLVTWPVTTLGRNFSEGCKIDGWKGMPKRRCCAPSFLPFAKNQVVYGQNDPPPPTTTKAKGNPRPGMGFRVTCQGRGQNLPPTNSAPMIGRITDFLWEVVCLKISLVCNFGDPRSISSRSNKFEFPKISHILWKSAYFGFSSSIRKKTITAI